MGDLVNFTLDIGSFDWCWYPHFWVYRPDKSSRGAVGFSWLALMIRFDFSRELASRSFLETGLYSGDPYKRNRPTFEVDWKKK